MPTVSVITAVHPEKKDYLDAAYDSLRRQQLPGTWTWEWIIQQDGDDRADSPTPPADDRISFGRNRRHGGPAVARTMALSRVSGEFVRVLDADDQLTDGALWRDIQVLTAHRDVCWTTSRVLDLLPDGTTTGFDSDPSPGMIRLGEVLEHWLLHDYRASVHPATLCVRTPLLLMLGGWMALPASEDTGLLLALNAVSVGYFIAEPGLLYRKWHGQSTADAAHADVDERATRMRVIAARARALRRSAGSLNDAVPSLTERC